jgi:predicted DNA-binding ribbon-helix-helix protein
MWSALKDIANREGCTMHEICSLVALRKRAQTSLTAAIRVFLMLYFRAATTEDGHRHAGHGSFENMRQRAKVPQGKILSHIPRTLSDTNGRISLRA